MAEYHIEQSELGVELNEQNIDKLECVVSGKVQKWKGTLAVVIAKNFRCRCFLSDGNVNFYGYDEDTKICSEVFYSMYKIGVKLSDKEKREIRSKYGTAKGVRNSFCLGFVEGIKSELEKQCTALMIVVPKEVDKKMYSEFSFCKKRGISAKNNFNKNVYDKGYQSGKDAIRSKGIEARY